MQFVIDDTFNTVAKMKVIGVGGAGGNAVNRMVQTGMEGVDFIAINTDAMALDNNMAQIRIQIGEKVTGGLGAGANPQIGMEAMEEDRDKVRAQLEGADLVFITAGMGGGTGTGAAPVVAEIARELGILSVGVVTKPFIFEGPVRERNAKAGLEALRNVVDTIIVIPNQKLLSIIEKTTTFREAFRLADEVLTSATRGISEIILKHGDIQVDFADVKAVMKHGGDALMGSGVAVGENRAIEAADRAIHSPLLDDVSIAGATGVLVNITGGDNLGMLEINDAMNYIHQAVGTDSNANIIFGTVINPRFEDEVSVTVIATGFGDKSAKGTRSERDFGALPAGRFMKRQEEPSRPEELPSRPSRPVRIDSLNQMQEEEQLSFPVLEEKLEKSEGSYSRDRSDYGSVPHLGASEGKYNPSEQEVDYETPAFLRYPFPGRNES